MTWKKTWMALLLALAAAGCHSATGFAGSPEMRPHKLKGPATAAMSVSPRDPEGEVKQPVRSLLASASSEDTRWSR